MYENTENQQIYNKSDLGRGQYQASGSLGKILKAGFSRPLCFLDLWLWMCVPSCSKLVERLLLLKQNFYK